MWFNIILANHGGAAAVVGQTPLVNYIRNMLSLCGHEVTVVYDNPNPRAINLYFEHFLGSTWAEQFLAFRRSGIKIGVIATELMVTAAGKRQIPYAQHGVAYPGDAQNRARLNLLRMEGFEAILGEVDFVWTFLKRTAEEYRHDTKFCEFLPVGSTGPIADYARRSPKDIDVFFYGKNTPHRMRVLQTMAQNGTKVLAVGQGFPGDWVPSCIIESLEDRAKIGLNLTLNGLEESHAIGVDPRFVSCGRVPEMLTRQVCIVSEDIPLDNPYSEFMESTEVEALSDLCRKLLDRETWADEAASKSARFHEMMDVRVVCRPVIERTLAAIMSGD